MAPSLVDDHAYFLKRSEHHRRMSDRATVASSKITHAQFAEAYARRAAELMVQQD